MNEAEETMDTAAPVSLGEPESASPGAARPATNSEEWDKVRHLALKQLDRFMSLEPKVLRGDDPDAIHDIRVASRRLQQVLDLISPPPPPREIRKLRRRIRRTRRALSVVRNCDVLLDLVDSALGRKRTPYREAWESVRHYLRQRRTASFERALKKMSKANLAIFYVRLKGYLTANGTAFHEFRHPQQLDLPTELHSGLFYERVGQSLDRVWQAFESQIEHSHLDPRGPVLHGVRIAAKRVRYLIEVIHAFDVAGSSETLAWLRKLQQHLGDGHDREVLEQMMIEMIARPEFLRDHLESAMAVEKLMLRERARKRVYVDKYLEMTRDSAEFRRVKDWVVYLRSSPSAAFAKT
jgi:CHAD domain-containing protein